MGIEQEYQKAILAIFKSIDEHIAALVANGISLNRMQIRESRDLRSGALLVDGVENFTWRISK